MVETNFHVCGVPENHLIKVINDMSIFRHSQEYGCSSIQREYSCCSPSVADIYRLNGLVRKYPGPRGVQAGTQKDRNRLDICAPNYLCVL